ncbi:MAG: haloacid dehalogenase type II [Candidatus Rokubacteria bacterium]|nr:haloacid dehalogenase type II [Candidatus Rokubacteria bacterium]
MVRGPIKAIAFDMYGTVVDVGAVARACKDVAPDPMAFNAQWRAKQLEYTFLRSLMGRYQDFWAVSEQALEFTLQRFGLGASPEQRRTLMEAWLHPSPYPDVGPALSRLEDRYPLALLSNGSPKMLRVGLERTGLRPYFRWVISVDSVKQYKPSPRVYQLAPKRMKVKKGEILFVSSNSFDVVGAKTFGFKVCWLNRTAAPLDPLGPRPDLVVKNMEELRVALERSAP